jgi:hypothetical protein
MTKRWMVALPVGVAAILVALAAPASALTVEDLVDDRCIDEARGTVVEGSIATLGDVQTDVEADTSRDADVDIDEDTVLLGIALSNNGASGVDFDRLRSAEEEAQARWVASQQVAYDREDVFNAIALGGDYGAVSGAGVIDCVSNVETSVDAQTSSSRETTLDEDTTILAIALGNSLGSEPEFDQVASTSWSESTSVSMSREVSIDRESVFAALLLGVTA